MSSHPQQSNSGPPSDNSNQISIFEEGIEIRHTKSYGVGIDCHSKFIQVSVIVKRDLHTYEFRHEFSTTLPVLSDSKDWAIATIRSSSIPPVEVTEDSLHYCIESTGSYHLPVIMMWKGEPSIVNPSLAGATKRKTDVLDAQLLAIHDLTGIWRTSHIPSSDIQQLRILLAERQQYQKMAIRINNRICNSLLKFGYTIARDGSVTKSAVIRQILEDELSDHPSPDMTYRPPGGLPEDVKCVFREDLALYDSYSGKTAEYAKKAVAKAKSMQWETRDCTVSGTDLLKILITAPYVGELTAVTWLSIIITPRRFPNSKALAAYCGLDPSLKISAKKVTSTKKRGGNKGLHSALTMAASNLMRLHSEPFGQWGYNIYCQTGKWKKGTNALARRLAIALYYMQLNMAPFSYEKYTLSKKPDVVNMTITQLSEINSDFRRYIAPLGTAQIHTTTELLDAYTECRLKNVRGLGKNSSVLSAISSTTSSFTGNHFNH